MHDHLHPRDILPALSEAWYGSPSARGPRVKRLGPAVHDVLEIAYHASFLREEDRPLKFRIAYLPRERAEDDLSPDVRIMRFPERRQFTAEEVRRLAPAAHFNHTIICVEDYAVGPNSNERRLGIWGLICVGSSRWNFSRRVQGQAFLGPDCLEVASRRPGQLVCARQDSLLLMLDGGRLIYPREVAGYPPPLQAQLKRSAAELASLIRSSYFGDSEAERKRTDLAHDVLERYQDRLIMSLEEQSHGSTTILVPERLASADDFRKLLRIKYELEPWTPSIWSSLREEALHISGVTESDIEYSRDECKRAIGDSLDVLASATGVDGAIVITDEYRLLGFGAEIRPGEGEPEFVWHASCPDNPVPKKKPIEFAGTRHRSAARLVHQHPETVAIVVSQDGAAKTIYNQDGVVVAYGHTALRGYAY